MSSVSDENDNAVIASTAGVGFRLQQAREGKKLSITEVATQLRFTKATVINLEQEEWEKLHSRTYARGYLLNYVKFLNLPSDEMLSAFNAQYGEVERPANLLSTKMFVDEKPFPWFSSIAIVIILVFGALSFHYLPPKDSKLSEAVSNNFNLTSPQTAAETDGSDSDVGIQPNPSNAQDTRDVSKDNDSEVLPSITEFLPVLDAESEQQSLAEPSVELAEINASEGQPQPAIDTEIVSETTVPSANTEANLTVLITEASWVEVKDATGNTLIRRVLEGETIDLTGPAPLAVRIGNVAGTTLRYNDVIVDLEAYRRNNVAKLTLGDDL